MCLVDPIEKVVVFTFNRNMWQSVKYRLDDGCAAATWAQNNDVRNRVHLFFGGGRLELSYTIFSSVWFGRVARCIFCTI